VPVIASDIAAHRETGSIHAEYLDPADGRGWMAALDAYLPEASARRDAALARLRTLKPLTWSAHFAALEELLGTKFQRAHN